MGQVIDKAIVNASVVLEQGIIWNGVILLAKDRIVQVCDAKETEIPKGVTIIDAKGAYVGPGFVDIHVHGGAGMHSFHEPEKVAEHFLRHGETTILATGSTSWAYDDVMNGVRRVKEAMKTVKNLKGINMEGPYMNPNYGAGKGMLTWNLVIEEKDFIPLVDELGDVVKIWSIAPEREGIMPFIRYARKVNPDVVLSIGHSEATPEQIRALGYKYRPKLMTHIMNATGRITQDAGGLRAYGPDEYCMGEPEMYAEMISDSLGIHVHSDLQRMVVKNKGYNRVVLITDSTSANGAAPEKYAHVTDINFNALGRISGSKLTMDQACRNVMHHTNSGIVQAFLMGSTNPARVIGMGEEIGSIEPGKKADFVFVDDKFHVQQVMLEGELCQFS